MVIVVEIKSSPNAYASIAYVERTHTKQDYTRELQYDNQLN